MCVYDTYGVVSMICICAATVLQIVASITGSNVKSIMDGPFDGHVAEVLAAVLQNSLYVGKETPFGRA